MIKSRSNNRSKCWNRLRWKNEEFRKFVKDAVKQVALNNPKDVEDLLAQKSIEEPELTVKEVLTNKIATIGENLTIRRFARFETEGMIENISMEKEKLLY